MAHQAPAAAQPEEYIACKLSGGRCLIPLTALYEVLRPPHRFALLPAAPQWMPGVVAWRGETIVAIDLDAYLSAHPADFPNEGMLLIADYEGLPLGLLVPALEEQTTPIAIEQVSTSAADQTQSWFLPSRSAFVKGIQDEALILHMPLLLAAMVQQIEIAASYG